MALEEIFFDTEFFDSPKSQTKFLIAKYYLLPAFKYLLNYTNCSNIHTKTKFKKTKMSGWEWSWGRPVITVGLLVLIFGIVFIVWLCKRGERNRKRKELQERMKSMPINNQSAQGVYQDFGNNGMLQSSYGNQGHSVQF